MMIRQPNQQIRQAVITTAGRATRLLPATKEQPKSMLPLFFSAWNGELVVRPIIQSIFEQLFDHEVREFYFIVGKAKRFVQDHFTPDPRYLEDLRTHARLIQADELQSFYLKVDESFLIWVNQPEPLGFGDAVLRGEGLVGEEPFLLHAGDTYVYSKTDLIARLSQVHIKDGADATLTLHRVDDPHMYGVAEVKEKGNGILEVRSVEEKPARSKSNYAIMALYAFNPTIMRSLRAIKPGAGGEFQLTDAIQHMIENGHEVQAIESDPGDTFLDVGSPTAYWEALETSHRHSVRSQHEM